MKPSFPRFAAGHHGVQPWKVKPRPDNYRSPYGPKYSIPTNFGGVDLKWLTKFGQTAAFWGIVAGAGAVIFAADVPRVKKDIWQKVPGIGDLFVKEIPASDNPF